MTATRLIRQIEELPSRERRKIFAYVSMALEQREIAADRKALAEARRDSRPAVPWEQVKAKHGLG